MFKLKICCNKPTLAVDYMNGVIINFESLGVTFIYYESKPCNF